jgi:uncharacterized membrane protein YjfL (UPF0719 family)
MSRFKSPWQILFSIQLKIKLTSPLTECNFVIISRHQTLHIYQLLINYINMGNIGVSEILLLLGTLISIVVSIYCVRKAEKLNRNRFGWALFGFCLPLIAFIFIQFMKPRKEI